MSFKGFVGLLFKQMLSDDIEMEPYTSVKNRLKKFRYNLLAMGTAVVHMILYSQY